MFCTYDHSGPDYISLEDLVALNRKDGDLFAHAERSGCEACYVEVARWCFDKHCYRRWAFCKFFGGEVPEIPDANDVETCRHVARIINEANSVYGDLAPVLHRMKNWGGGE